MLGPDKNLEKEAERVISKLPKMIPGKEELEPKESLKNTHQRMVSKGRQLKIEKIILYEF